MGLVTGFSIGHAIIAGAPARPATTLFDLDRRLPGDGKPAVIYARDKRHAGRPKS